MSISVLTSTQALDYAQFYCSTIGDRKFCDNDLMNDGLLVDAATDYIQYYTGNFEFMLDLRDKAGIKRTGLSIGQLRGALNVLRAEVNRGNKPAQMASKQEVIAKATNPPTPGFTYTVAWPEDGTWTTIKIADTENWQGFEGTGMLVAKYLAGPDNETSFNGFAFIKPNGEIVLWKKYREGDVAGRSRITDALRVICQTEDRGALTQLYAEKSGRCSKCGRTLTVPASLHRGMGPICAKGGEDAD